MSDSSSSTSSPPPGGVSRFVGVGLSLIIGLVTFTVGVSLFPVELPRPPAPPPRAPLAAPPIAPSSPPPSGNDAGGDAGSIDGATGGGSDLHKGDTNSADAAAPAAAAPAPRRSKTSRSKEKEPADASADEEPKTGAGGADGAGGAGGDSDENGATTASGDDADGGMPVAPPADCTLPDKDIAREAWRHNWPTICPSPDSKKGFIIIPVKGSIENAVGELKRKPVREARVTVSGGESLLTLKIYKLRRLGFKDLKIGPGDDGTGTRFRVRLMNGAGDPVFDVKDGYAKITVASPPE